MDKHIEEALKVREEMAMAATNHREFHPSNDPNLSRAFASALRSSQVIVWEHAALEAFNEFWSQKQNRDTLDRMVYEKYDTPVIIRRIKDLCRNTFNYFPVNAFQCMPEFTPPSCNDKRGAVTQVKAFLFYPYGGKTEFCSAQYPTFQDSDVMEKQVAKYFTDNNMSFDQIASFRLGLLHSETPFYQKLRAQMNAKARRSALSDHHLPVGDDEKVITDFITCGWIYMAYQLTMFLEQPFVSTDIRKIKKAQGRKLGAKPNEVIQTVYLRKAYKPNTKIVIPHVSKYTGRVLVFEHDVRGHMRKCATGKIVWVKSHKRGPRGVIRTRVIKAVR